MSKKLTRTDRRMRKEMNKFEAGAEPSPWLLRQCMRPKYKQLCARVLPGLYRSIHPKTLAEEYYELMQKEYCDTVIEVIKAPYMFYDWIQCDQLSR